MTQQQQHLDVAAYALGVLDDRDAARFEDHLVECQTCAIELESLVPVVDVLSDIDAESFIATEQARHDGVVLQKVLVEVKKERHRANSRRLYSLAAAVIVFAMLSIGALFAGGRWLAPQQQAPTPQVQNSLEPLPPDTGFGGPTSIGEHRGATDPRTNVRADVGLETKDWGTQVSLSLSNVKGPRTCRLVAVRRNGEPEVLTTWTVGEKGWGTAAQREALRIQAVTALPRSEIAALQVQSLDAAGNTENLVTVP